MAVQIPTTPDPVATPPESVPATSQQTAPEFIHVFFRPELQYPPMDPNTTVGFSFITGTGEAENYTFHAGVNKIPYQAWKRVKQQTYAQTLLEQEAFRIMPEQEIKQVLTDKDLIADSAVDLSKFKVSDAVTVVETSFDLDALKKWFSHERRIPVRNALTRRIEQLTKGTA